jgi:hypothetical protein
MGVGLFHTALAFNRDVVKFPFHFSIFGNKCLSFHFHFHVETKWKQNENTVSSIFPSYFTNTLFLIN